MKKDTQENRLKCEHSDFTFFLFLLSSVSYSCSCLAGDFANDFASQFVNFFHKSFIVKR
jgi:hypothetical protein